MSEVIGSKVEVVVDGITWAVKWHHSPFQTKTIKHFDRPFTVAVPRYTDCGVFADGEMVEASRVSVKTSSRKPWQQRAAGEPPDDHFSRATGRKESMRRALSPHEHKYDPTLLIPCRVPQNVRKALWDRYHEIWPHNPLEAFVRELEAEVLAEVNAAFPANGQVG